MPVKQINVQVVTGKKNNAGTDGEVYLGIFGREFYLDSSHDDFERASDFTYILGEGANINHSSDNDPRLPALSADQMGGFPVYIRFEPFGGSPDWNVERVLVTVTSGRNEEIRFANLLLENIWLGQKSGKFIYLSRF